MFPIDEFKPTAEMLNAKTFPRGIEFKPSGDQLIEDFLLPWAKGEKLEWEGIAEKKMYGENFPCEPWKVFSDIESAYHSKMEEKGAIKYTIHAFTTLLRASNSKRVSRRAGKGTWRGQTAPKKIENSQTGCIIGQSKMLAYDHPGEADVGHWTLHEYCLSGESVKKSGRSNAADFVVCKVTKTVKKKPSDGIRAAEANEFLSQETEVPFANPGVDPFAQPNVVLISLQSDERHAPLQPLVDADKFLFPANEVPFANPGFDPFAQPNIFSIVQQSNERHAPLQPLEDANKFLLPGYEVPSVKPGVVSTVQQSDVFFSTSAVQFMSPENEVPFSILEPYYGSYEVPVVEPEMMSYPRISDGLIVQPYCGGYEAPVPASPTVSMKRAAEVDLLRNGEDSDMKRQKCDGEEFSDDSFDWKKEFGDLFDSDFQQLMEAETRPQPNPEGSGDGWVPQPMITHGANAFDVTVPTEEQQRRFFFGENEGPERRHGDSFFLGDQQVPSTAVNRRL